MRKIIENEDQKERICRDILQQLSEWFEMPESIENYAKKCRELPFWSIVLDEKNIGFLALQETSQYTAEIYVMGVLKEFHRQGAGQELFHAAYSYARETGYEFLQVKTVQAGKYPEYNKTNSFYKKIGFRELECMPLWDEDNPCQVYVMAVK